MIDLATLPIEWDAVVVGAGPAGAAAATLLADRGWRVLLVEKSKWPREKTCGGCVNADAVATLRRMNLHGVLRKASTITGVRISHDKNRFNVDSSGVAIERSELDQKLVEHAVQCGVTFLPATGAKLIPEMPTQRAPAQSPAAPPRKTVIDDRTLTLINQSGAAHIKANLVLACDGINGTLLKDEPWATWTISRRAWMGVSCTLPPDEISIPGNAIHMHIGSGGYVGLVRLPDGRVHVGAALDSQRSRQFGGPASHVQSILRENGIHTNIDHLLGTGLLTRHRKIIGGHRVLCIGDACGYVEPFTGEGIAWALASAEAVVSLLPNDLIEWPDDLPTKWKRLHRQTIGRRQRMCHLIRFAVRRPLLWKAASAIARRWPMAAHWVAPQPAAGWAGESHA